MTPMNAWPFVAGQPGANRSVHRRRSISANLYFGGILKQGQIRAEVSAISDLRQRHM
jgi:hypothetical protein